MTEGKPNAQMNERTNGQTGRQKIPLSILCGSNSLLSQVHVFTEYTSADS